MKEYEQDLSHIITAKTGLIIKISVLSQRKKENPSLIG